MRIVNNCEVAICDTDKTKSGRIYPLQVMQDMVAEVNRVRMPVLGQFSGSTTSSVDLDKVTHQVSNIRIEDNKVIGDVTLLDTPHGITMQSLYDSDCNLRCCIRGSGYVDAGGVVSDFELLAIDIEMC